MRQNFACRATARLCLMVFVMSLLGACSAAIDPVMVEETDDTSNSGNDGEDASSGGQNQNDDFLTEAPDADDEPILEQPEFNTAVGFEVYRDRHPGLPTIIAPEDMKVELEYTPVLSPAVLVTPEGLDTQSNQPPYFPNIQNQDVLAGDIVSIRFKPEDPDGEAGGLPGLYVEELPWGSEFDDNFDGSRTFSWQPVQADVGVHRLTVVAVDGLVPEYRSVQSVLVRVTMPDDISVIPNVAPTLEELEDYTVRVNDPVVVELKGIDRNGTVPTLEIPTLPAGGSFNQHPRFDEKFVLKFTPTVTGKFTFNVLVRDSVDTSLTSTQPVSVDVLDAQAFVNASVALKDLAAAFDKKIGFAAIPSFYHQPDGAIYAEVAAREFNIVTPENSMKMEVINPLPGRYDFAATDNLVRFARLHDISLHAHASIWHRQLPTWILNSDIAEREQHMVEFIDRIMGRYASDMAVWDVVNEPVGDDGNMRDSVWFEAMGEQYIDIALNRARQLAPDGVLLINEYGINSEGPKFDSLVGLVERLLQRGVALDGIGFQLHLFSDFSTFDELSSNFETIASLGLDVYITELDVSITGEPTAQALQQQADVYRQITTLCLEQAACKAIQMWGFTDQYSFRWNYNPLPFDRSYKAKPAYQALQDALSGSTE